MPKMEGNRVKKKRWRATVNFLTMIKDQTREGIRVTLAKSSCNNDFISEVVIQ
jgi:hypothetical protein